MTNKEVFSAYLGGLNSRLHEQVGAHVQGNLEQAIAMAQQIDVYWDGNVGKGKGQTVKKFKKQKKGYVT